MSLAAKAPPQKAVPNAADLLRWYDRHRRVLPWRARKGERADPYRVWLSEIMLQQTTVKAVAPYYARFLARFPAVAELAAAPLEDVLKLWAGLGYYARARNLHACAKAVVERHGGEFPGTEDGLRALARHRRLHGRRDRGDCVRSAGKSGRWQYRARDRAPVRRRGGIAGRQAAHPRARRESHASTPRRRFRAGHDGSRRHDLHAEETGLRALSMDGVMRRARARRSGELPAQGGEEDRRAAPRCGVRRRARGWFPPRAHASREGAAWRHDRSADDRMAS